MIRWVRTVGMLIQKEWRLEWRSKELLTLLVCNAILFAVLVGAGVSSAVLDASTTEKLFAMLLWIVFMLSIASIVLLYGMLRTGSASKVSSLYYLVPPVAAIQAYFLFDEVIGPVGIIGMAFAGLGVVLVMRQSTKV